MSRRKYREYKQDDSIKTPLFAWLMDRSIIYVAVFATAGMFVGGFLKEGYDSFQSVVAEPEVDSPYQDIVATNSPGMNWAYSLINKKPTTVEEWKVSDSKNPRHLFDVSRCSGQGDVPATVLATYSASGSSIETRIQVYGAGQAAAQYEIYKKVYNNCFDKVESAENELGSTVKFDKGFVITLGDSIISVTAPDNDVRDELLKFYLDEASQSLVESGCIALTVTSDDANRSFFYNPDSYTGLLEKKTISTQIGIDDLPSPEIFDLSDIDDTSAVEPEAPLPEDFPSLPKEVDKPTIPSDVEDKDNFDKVAKFKIVDSKGPGCGWAWSSQKSPTYDNDALISERENSVKAAQTASNEEASIYVQSKRDWAFNVALILPQADAWNKYVAKVNKVHKKWAWLDHERSLIKDSWYKYVEEYNDWLSFDDRKKDASDAYDKELEECKAKQDDLNAWEEEWGDLYDQQEAEKDNPTESPEPSDEPSSSPTPTVVIPERPEGCTNIPERPSILDEDKPDEPQPPSIPAGVTIPDSWAKPGE